MNYYTVAILKKKLRYCADMLRYDACFDFRDRDDMYELDLCRYTPDRWASFNAYPQLVGEHKIPAGEWIGRLGSSIPLRIRAYLIGIQMAVKQNTGLKVRSSHSAVKKQEESED